VVVPNVSRTRSPKKTLTGLWEKSPQAAVPRAAAWKAIARHVLLPRSAHAQATGLATFAEDLTRELA
jgi:hypothetical protein